MTAKEIREKYLNFFKSPPRNHKEISPAPLVLENDPTTLFTSSGMQPLVPYLMGEPYSKGKRLVDSQPCIRTVDIDDVGDNRHLTFFEMLGNWSLGDYFKKEQLPWIWEFFTKELELSKDRLWVSVFEGNEQIPKDEESENVWKSLGLPDDKICYYGVENNWWSRSGTPEQMPIGEIGGPDSEIFYDFGEELKIHENSPYRNEKCHPNCSCGRFLEIGNCVFIQYKKVEEGKLEELPQKNVDFGGGLERITAAVNNNPDIFKIDLFEEIIKKIEEACNVKYGISEGKDRIIRIITDHLRASDALINNGIIPSNKLQGYVLRRLIRRMVINLNELDEKLGLDKFIMLTKNEVTLDEIEKFKVTLNKGLNMQKKDLELLENDPKGAIVKAEEIWKYYKSTFGDIASGYPKNSLPSVVAGTMSLSEVTTYGLPAEETIDMFSKNIPGINKEIMTKVVKEGMEKHRELSRTTSEGVFKGGLADHSPEVIRFHTATHLLLASLRKVLGEHVVQKGQNITKERSRFDFPNPEKLTDEQIKEVVDTINDVVQKDLTINFKVMPKEEALKTGAIHAFNEKYADTVKVYYIGNDLDNAFSKEFCGGPHVANTSEIGRVKINKQEKIGSGIIRIYLIFDK